MNIDKPEIAEDRRRLQEFARTHEAISLHQMKVWIESWGTENELPKPQPQHIG